MVSNEVAVRRVSRAAQELRGGGREGHWVLRAAERPTPHEVRHLGETGKNLVSGDAAFAVRREVVLPLQGRGLARGAHEVHRPVLGHEVGAGPAHVEAGGTRMDIKDDELHVVRGVVADARSRRCLCFMPFHWEH